MAKALYRYFQVERSALTEVAGKKSLRVAFSSETPVLRVGDGFDFPEGQKYYEQLSHDAADADISLLQRGAFIDEHDWAQQIGATSNATIDADRKGRADLSFAETELGKVRYELMSTGFRPDISFGYVHTALISRSVAEDGIPLLRLAWAAHEITSTAVGADRFETGVGRSYTRSYEPGKTAPLDSKIVPALDP